MRALHKKPIKLHGVGINDANYYVIRRDKSRKIVWRCPFYKVWASMLSRCYSKNQKPCYAGCTVSTEWFSFMVFRKWMEGQKWEGLYLDKDILVPKNKTYSASTCLFVTRLVNNLLCAQEANRGEWALGVYFNKTLGKFVSKLRVDGKSVHLGCFEKESEASSAYIEAKTKRVSKVAMEQSDLRVREALLNYLNGKFI